MGVRVPSVVYRTMLDYCQGLWAAFRDNLRTLEKRGVFLLGSGFLHLAYLPSQKLYEKRLELSLPSNAIHSWGLSFF